MLAKPNLKQRLKKKGEKLFRRHRTASASPSTTPSIANDQSAEQENADDRSKESLIVGTTSHAFPSPSTADPQITRPSIEARPAVHHLPLAASQVPRPATPLESLPKLALTEPIERSNPALSVSEELWNAAYDDLEAAEAELVGSYVKTLKEVLGDETAEPSTIDLLAEMEDPIKRQKYMREMVQRGQERISNVSKIATKVGDIADFILSSKGVVNLTLQSVPQAAPAALPWAGVCLGLEILRNPAQATKSNLDGIAHVISRMDWYCALTELLLNKNNIADGNDSQTVLCQLKERIVELYKALLLYQMRSVVSYYRNQAVRFLRDIVKLDDWESDINLVKDIESTLRGDMDKYYQEHTKTSLNELAGHADELTTLLGNIRQDIRSFILQQKVATRDSDESNCRKDLRVVDPEDDMKRIENNKDKLLDEAYKWIFDTDEYRMFSNWENGGSESTHHQLLWLKGHAGTGKTMLMIGLIRQFSNQSAALAPGISFFFCQGTDTKLNNATAVLRSLIWLLLLQQPCLMSHLLQRYKDSGANLFKDQNAFIALSEVLKNMLGDDKLSPVYLAVDALDECSEGRADLIALISTTLTLSKNVKWLLSSRPEVDVLAELKTSETLVELDTQRLGSPVKAYIEHKLSILKDKKGYNDEILKKVSDIVNQRAGNAFLWVALAFKALGEKHGVYAIGIISKMPPGLSKLYQHMMTRIENSKRIEPSDCKKVLKAAFLAFRPLCLSELSLVTGLLPDITKNAAEECGSFLTITGETVNLIHQSAKDYLKVEYTAKLDPAGVAQGHIDLIAGSLNAISSLEQNVYKLDPGTKTENMTPPNPDPLTPLQYSCISWIDHLRALNDEDPECLKTLSAKVLKFLKTGFLRWLESLSLLGKVEDGVLSLKELLRLVQTQMDVDSGLVEFLKDADKFFLTYRSIIEQSPLQTYGSALVFSPTTSVVRNQYWDERLPLAEIIVGFRDHWGTHQTLEGHTGAVKAVAFSPDGKTLASASSDGTIRLWDAATGAHRQTLGDRRSSVYAIAFSRDGETLASGSRNHKIQLWDVATSVCRQTLEGHTGNVKTVAFSADGNTLASASGDHTVRLWDLARGVCRQTLEGHTDEVTAVVFSPDGNTIASGSLDCTVGLWDAATGVRHQTLEGHHSMVTAVVFSPDGNTIVLSLDDGTVGLWDAATGVRHQTLRHTDGVSVSAVALSPDGNTLASASWDQNLWLWDARTGTHTQTLEGHTHFVSAVAFSPDGKTLASGSDDETVRLWDITATPPNSKTLEGHSDSISMVVFSPNGKTLASASDDKTVRLWDITATPPNSKTLEGHSDSISMVVFSPNGKTLASASYDETVWLWDITATPPNSKTLEGHSDSISMVVFSPNGKTLASASYDRTVRLWDITAASPNSRVISTGVTIVDKVVFSPDGKILEATSWGAEVQHWDVVTGSCLSSNVRPLSDHNRSDNLGYSISEDDSWISLNGKGLLWLPVDYRPSQWEQSAVHGSTVAVGTRAGKFVVMRFS